MKILTLSAQFLIAVLIIYSPSRTVAFDWDGPVVTPVVTEEILDIYIDQSDVKRDGDFVFFWVLTNYHKKRYGKYSFLFRRKANCRNMSYQDIEWYEFEGPMGTGNKTKIDIDFPTYEPPEGGNQYFLLMKMCD